jgi:PKD repeat protein
VTQDVDDWSAPHVYGNYLVWCAKGGIYLRYMSPYKGVNSWQMRISDGYYADIYDTKVVYADDDGRVRLYDISTNKTIDVPGYGAGDTRIWGTEVIWSDLINNQGYIAMYDTSTNTSIDVTHELVQMPNGDDDWGASTGSHIAIQGDKIVYNKCVDDYEGVAGVYVYSIASGKSTLLSQYYYSPDGDYVDTTPEVYRNTVVWGMHRILYSDTDDSGIYVTTIPTKPVTPVFPGYTKPPTDPNHDGLYEDINGNGILDFDDVVAYYDNMDWIEANSSVALFDYNKNGLIDFDDVVKLYDML